MLQQGQCNEGNEDPEDLFFACNSTENLGVVICSRLYVITWKMADGLIP